MCAGFESWYVSSLVIVLTILHYVAFSCTVQIILMVVSAQIHRESKEGSQTVPQTALSMLFIKVITILLMFAS